MTWTPTKPLSPEEVAKLRLPEGYFLQLNPFGPLGNLDGGFDDSHAWVRAYRRGANRDESILADVAQAVANGHLPTVVLDLVWAVVEGRVERITVGSAYYYGGPQDVRTIEPEPVDELWAIVEGRVERITVGSADYYGGPQDVRTIEPEPVDELVTHLLLQVKP